MTRCKVGDLAVITRSTAGNEGKIVRVIRPATARETCGWDHYNEGFHWWIECLSGFIDSTMGAANRETAFPDARLRPLRDPGDDAVDETLLLIPSPVETA